MKKSDLQKMLGLIDDDILKEAAPKGSKPKSRTAMWLKIVSAAACFLLIFNVALLPAALLMSGKISSLKDELGEKNQIIQNILGNGSGAENESPSKKEPIYNQNVVHLPLGNGDRVVTLASPLLSAPSKYDDIISNMVEIMPSLGKDWLPGGNLGDLNDSVKEEQDEESGDMNESMGDLSDAMENPKYEETTDLQVNGIIEGDLIKRSSEYIYYLSGTMLKIYSIKGHASELVGAYSLEKHIDALNTALKIPEQPKTDSNNLLEEEKQEILDDIYYDNTVSEMFLSTDLKTITVICENRVDTDNINELYDMDAYNRGLYCTSLISINVEDAKNVYLNDITTVFGRYESARLINGNFLLFTKYTPVANELIIPQYNDGEGFEYIPRENIYSPENYKSANYTISYRINGESYDVYDAFAYASFDGEVYVTENNIYLTREYDEKTKIYSEYPVYAKDVTDDEGIDPGMVLGYGTKTTTYKKRVTEILRVDVSGGVFKPMGSLTVNGYIKDRYSLHENGEYFYVVTTDSNATASVTYKDDFKNRDYNDVILDIMDTRSTSANIYVADVQTMAIISSIERFAPEGETVRSVRFDGDKAYVCTAVEIVDPVFFFDLSDPKNITYTDTGTIPGFSNNLIQLKNGELLGIGTERDGYVKIEVYKQVGNEVVVVATQKIKASYYSTDYKAHFIDRKNGYIGLGITDYKQSRYERYVMLHYENGYFSVIIDCELNGTLSSKRAVYIDGCFYLFASKDFVVIEK